LVVCQHFFSSTFFGSVTNFVSSTFFGSVYNIFSSTLLGVLPTFFVNIFRKFANIFSHRHFSEVFPHFFLVNIFQDQHFSSSSKHFFRNVSTFLRNIGFINYFCHYFAKCCSILEVFDNIFLHF
jgi:hypothetical protein